MTFVNKLNRTIYGAKFDSDTQVSMDDIAKARGTSQSKAPQMYSRFKTWKRKSKFVSDKSVDKILQAKETKIEAITRVFDRAGADYQRPETSDKKALKLSCTERKKSADLAKLFHKASDRVYDSIPMKAAGTPEKEQQKKLWDLGKKTWAVEPMMRALARVEQYDPEELLRAAVYDAKKEAKGKTIRDDFIKYLGGYPHSIENKAELNAAYEHFIKEKIVLKNTSSANVDYVKKMKQYSKDRSLKSYKRALTFHVTRAKETENLSIDALLARFPGLKLEA